MTTHCLIEDCVTKKQHIRGLCKSHYLKFAYKIRQGKYTWKEIQEYGQALPNGQYNISAFRKIFLILAKRQEKLRKLITVEK